MPDVLPATEIANDPMVIPMVIEPPCTIYPRVEGSRCDPRPL